MPDQPGKGPQSSAPLSAADADRLAESFTAFWDDDSAPAAAPPPAEAGTVTAPMPAVAPVHTGTAASPAPAPAAAPTGKHVGKQTLLGMAPFTFGKPEPAFAPPQPIEPAPQPHPVTVTAPLPTVAAPNAQAKPLVHSKTLLGFSVPFASPAASPTSPAPFARTAPFETPPAAIMPALATATPLVAPPVDPVTTPAPIQQSPSEVPGYAIAYTPKDGPATPPVVIAPEAQSSPENKRPFSATIPSRRPALTPAAPLPAFDDDDLQLYAPKKGNGKLIAGVIGGAVVLLIGIVGIRALMGGSAPSPVASDAVTSAPNDPPGATLPAAAPALEAPATQPLVSEATRAPAAHEPAHAQKAPGHLVAPPIPAAAARPKSAAAPRPASRPPAATFPSEPASASKPAGSKGVIVRDAPF